MWGKRPSLSVIITEEVESSFVQQVLERCLFLAPREIILVSPFDRSSLMQSFREQSHTSFVYVQHEGGVDFEGRVVGASHATADVCLFLDAEYVLDALTLQRFLFPVFFGKAHAVLRQDHRLELHDKFRSLQAWKYLANQLAGRPELGSASLLDGPHVLTREAIQLIGIKDLAHPVHAMNQLSRSRLSIQCQMIQTNLNERYSFALHGSLLYELSAYEQLRITDYLSEFGRMKPRGGYADGERRRDIVNDVWTRPEEMTVVRSVSCSGRTSNLFGSNRLSVVIPAQNEEKTIGEVIRETRKLQPDEIIVVVNGSTDQTANIAQQHGATTVLFEQSLGVDTGRAIGASIAKGEILLFLDADFALPARELYPFVLACSRGIDLALNLFPSEWQRLIANHPVLAARYALNEAIQRKDLGVSSMTIVPFAMSRKAVEAIGWPTLLCPPKAQAACALSECTIQLVHQVNVERRNRFRPKKHISFSGQSKAVQQILGDHVEAIQYLYTKKNQGGVES